MSTSGNLPAGFTTQIDGKQCTAVPRSEARSVAAAGTSSSVPAAATTVSTSAAIEAISSVSHEQSIPPDDSQSTFSTSTTAPVVSIITTPQPISTSSKIPPTGAVAPPPAPIEISTSEPQSTSTAELNLSATPTSRLTTLTTSSSTLNPIALSEIDTPSSALEPTATSNNQNSTPPSVTSQSLTSSTPSTTPSAQDQSSAASGISSDSKVEAGPIVGGILGSVAVIAILGVIFWYCRRRRRWGGSYLTPLTVREEKGFYEIDSASVGPSKRSAKWKAEAGYQKGKVSKIVTTVRIDLENFVSSLESKVAGKRSDTPSVNLNRGNSQFLDGPIPQHSRNNSVLSNITHITARDRLNAWWDRVTENMAFSWYLRRQAKEPVDPFAAARSMTDKQANIDRQPVFSQLLGTGDRELSLPAERRRPSLSSSISNLGSLGLDFESHDPFADPVPAAKSQTVGWVPPNPNSSSSPFSDPVPQPERSIPKAKTYISDIRRSRGLSVDAGNDTSAYAANNTAYRPPSTATGSRYPSSIAPSRDSYRDTVFSAFSSNARKGKGRSDPFDLERPELWHSKILPVQEIKRSSTRPRGASIEGRESTDMYPNPLQPNPVRKSSMRVTAIRRTDSNDPQPRIVSNNWYASKYSSGVSNIGDWGDPGPDLGAGIASNSGLRGNALSNDRGNFVNPAARVVYGEDVVKGSLAEIQNPRNSIDTRRAKDNVSPISNANSKHGVGKAR